MATFDLTAGSTFSTEAANSIAALPESRRPAYLVEAILDLSKIDNYTNANGDIFQVLEIPAGTLVLAAGDDIVDGGDVTSLGYLASGTNGGANVTSATTWVQLVTTTDTIDVKLIAASADVTVGKLRVYAIAIDVDGVAETAVEVDRDQLA